MLEKKVLSNGLKVIVSPMAHMTSVSIGIWIGAGGRYETKKLSGASHFIEHMLFKGTTKYTAKQLKEAIEGVGGMFNGFTADEVTCYMIKVPADYLTLGLDVLTDMVFNSRFDSVDMQKEKYVICEEIKMYKDQPSEYVGELLAELMWPGNPLGMPLTGSISNVKGFKREDLLSYRDLTYQPFNMSVIVVGKVSPKEIFSYTESKFPNNKKHKLNVDTPSLSQKSPRFKVELRKTNQTQIAFGFPVEDNNINERIAIKILSIILGGNMSSRLFEELREKYGLCYDIASEYKRHSDIGEFAIHAGVDNEKASESTSAIVDELKKIKDLGVTADELVRAKEFAKGQFLLSLENTSSRMMWLGYRVMIDKNIPVVDELLKKIDGVSLSMVQNLCNRIFQPKAINAAMIGNLTPSARTKIRKTLDTL
ncbi:zinc protease [Candidatus Omnitrophus magneticus]|uniref:Zinc protease n=1 Tax=Candidatus Omnitrophus magneticus TaxID=1609969 RepID=A0A0F0CTX1_9BACT|nr:zinc protease [Candidatus Omnitrophus magneticus]